MGKIVKDLLYYQCLARTYADEVEMLENAVTMVDSIDLPLIQMELKEAYINYLQCCKEIVRLSKVEKIVDLTDLKEAKEMLSLYGWMLAK